MPLPGNVSTGTVTGHFDSGGAPGKGLVRFIPEAEYLLDASANAILLSLADYALLDASGSFTKVLAATSDPDLVPGAWTWRVRPLVQGVTIEAFSMYLAADTTIDLADVTPVPSSGGSSGSGEAPTGVVAGTYGSASQVPVVTVNAYGRVTVASQVPVKAELLVLVGAAPVPGGTPAGTVIVRV